MSPDARKRKQDCYYLLSYDFSKYVYFETIQIFLSVQFSNFIYLMQVAQLLMMLSHPSCCLCELWLPVLILLLNFVNDDQKCNSYPECAGKCTKYLFFWSCSINYSEFYSLNVEHHIFQQCLLLNSLGRISQFLECKLFLC